MLFFTCTIPVHCKTCTKMKEGWRNLKRNKLNLSFSILFCNLLESVCIVMKYRCTGNQWHDINFLSMNFNNIEIWKTSIGVVYLLSYALREGAGSEFCYDQMISELILLFKTLQRGGVGVVFSRYITSELPHREKSILWNLACRYILRWLNFQCVSWFHHHVIRQEKF